jgi:hypothetical protein
MQHVHALFRRSHTAPYGVQTGSWNIEQGSGSFPKLQVSAPELELVRPPPEPFPPVPPPPLPPIPLEVLELEVLVVLDDEVLVEVLDAEEPPVLFCPTFTPVPQPRLRASEAVQRLMAS